jgi:thiol-disulfide isomerase/thioredoxin
MSANFRYHWLAALLTLSLATFSTCTATPSDTGTTSAAAGEKVISFGQQVNLQDHLVKGKTVIFDFFSQYCPPCRRISPLLNKLAEKRSDIVVIKVDINRKDVTGIDWASPVAQQYQLQGIPHFKIYSPEGKLKAEGDAAYEQVVTLLKQENIQ